MSSNRFFRSPSDQFLSKRQENEAPAEEAQFTWFSPPGHGEDRVKFMVTRENGDELSVLPGQEGRFKKGLRAWRWKDEETSEDHEIYTVVKTRHNRIDLRRLPGE